LPTNNDDRDNPDREQESWGGGSAVWRTLNDLRVKTEVLRTRLTSVEEDIDRRLKVIDDGVAKLVTRPEFTPVKLLTYGLAGSLLAGIVAAILSLVIHK
jgi:hypothetical protein